MGEMVNSLVEVVNLFTASQHTAGCHQKNSILLRKVYQTSPFEKFCDAFLRPISLILWMDYKQNSPYVNRMIQFVGVFCAAIKRIQPDEDTNSAEEPLILKLFEYLLQASTCDSDTARFRSCQLINKILDHLVEFEINVNLFTQIQEILMDRLSDSKAVIRFQAILALYRLQDPTDSEDSLIYELVQRMYDTQATIRGLIVEKIAYRRDVIDHIVKRTRDIAVNVRLAAFSRLAKFAKKLKITDRRTVLFTGISDKSEKIRHYVLTEFLASWWDIYDNDITLLMRSLRLDADEEDIELTARLYTEVLNNFYFKTRTFKEILDVLPLTGEKLLPYETLNWETIAYWRHLISLLSSENVDLESHLGDVIPEVVFICRYVKGYSDYSVERSSENYLERQFIIKQLFHIIRICDLSDPHTIGTVHTLVVYILKKEDLMDDTLETIMGTLIQTIPNDETRCRYGMEVISDILCPLDAEEELRKSQEKEFQLSKLKVHLGTLQIDQEKALAVTDFLEAERLKHMIEDVSFQINALKNSIYTPQDITKKTNDLSAICKCLDIAWAILRTADVITLTPSLKSLKNEFLPEFLVHKNNIIRLKALRCFAMCCIYDKPTAQQGIHIFAVPIIDYQAGQECDIQTLIICISVVSDLIRLFGSDLIAEPNEDQLSMSVDEEHQKVFAGGTSLTTLIQGLVDLMDDEQYNIQLKATEALCKLLLYERIHSASLISKIILKWCNPVDNEEIECQTLRQFVGYVLERLGHLPNIANQLEKAIIITIDILAKAPKTSPLASVDIDNITKFMLALSKLSPKSEVIHCNIAMSLCTKINQNPESKINVIYSKILLMLHLPDDLPFIEELFALADEAREFVHEKVILRNLTKLLSTLCGILKGNKKATEKTALDLIEESEEEEECLMDEV